MPDYTIRAQGAARSTETDLDDGITYHLDLEETAWGEATQPEPQDLQTIEGSALILPLDQAWNRRVLKLSGALECSSHNDKLLKLSTLTALLRGRKTIRRKGWEIDAYGLAPVELGPSKRTPYLILYETTFYATPPFWEHAVALNAIAYDSLLYPDFGVPMGEAQPSYVFGHAAGATALTSANPGAGLPHFTISNWGTAFTYPGAALSGFGALTEVYLKGAGMFRVRVPLSGGAGTLSEVQRFYLASGNNAIRLEDAAGAALNLSSGTYPSLKLDFGATIVRYL